MHHNEQGRVGTATDSVRELQPDLNFLIDSRLMAHMREAYTADTNGVHMRDYELLNGTIVVEGVDCLR
jgi:hypothetical protein